MAKKTKLLPLIGIERTSREYSWARLYLPGKTVSVELSNIIFYPCTSKPPRTEVAYTEETEASSVGNYVYTKKSAGIYATSSKIESICISLGIGTIKNPVPVFEKEKENF